MPEAPPPPDLHVTTLLRTPTVVIRDVRCSGACRHRSAEECARNTHLVYPYRGAYVRHVGGYDAVATSNQVLHFNAGEGYQISHPITGGDNSFVLEPDESVLREIAPKERTVEGERIRLRNQRATLDPRAQALAALLRHSLQTGAIEPLEAETLALTLMNRTLGERTSREPGGSRSHQKLVDRTKIALATDLSKRWTLADIAAEIGVSPVYLTQVFQRVEGVPLYRYQLRLRLARALDLIETAEDLSQVALEVGFSSHAHFSAAFTRTYGRSPAAFRDAVRPPKPAR